MLDYDWGNLVTGDGEPSQHSDQSSQIFDHYSQPFNENLINPNHNGFNFHNPQIQNTHFQPLYDPRAYGPSPSYPVPPPGMLSLETVPSGSEGYMLVPKIEPGGIDYTSRIGLNLGGRTYFSSAEDDFVNRLYRRSRTGESGSVSPPRCQTEGCNADLTHAKHYHRRHKVCEFHSKAATVIAAGLTQRFCQQCSRFHLLTEFDNGKRSCRRRLADHNRRRRKTHQTNQDHSKSQPENAPNSSTENLARSSPPSSSVTMAISPPQISLDSLRHRPYQAPSSSVSTSSLFFTNG